MTVELHFQQESNAEDIPSEADFTTWVQATLTQQQRTTAELTIRIVDKEEMAALNETYRKKPGPTNVLSFPYEVEEFMDLDLMGDTVLCAPVIAEQAQAYNKPSIEHWAHLTVHSTLHLLGYDHIQEDDAKEMESLEISIMKSLGYPNPYGDDNH